MRPVVVVALAGADVKPAGGGLILDYISGGEVSLQCVVSGGTAVYTIEQTFDDPFGSTQAWSAVPVAALVGATANQTGVLTAVPRAVRCNKASGTGIVTMTAVQSPT